MDNITHINHVQAIILGFIQGLTEYIPVSSSAHLVLLPKIFGWHFRSDEAFIFDILVQLGTLLGVCGYFFTAIIDMAKSMLLGLRYHKPFYDHHAKLGYLLIMATLPAALLGYYFKDDMAGFFITPLPSCYFLIVTAILLLSAEYLSTVTKNLPSNIDALIIGMAQGLALFPGVSRSGATISLGMFCGLSRKDAASFSFLLSIPIMLGASLLAVNELINNHDLLFHLATPLMLGFITAAITGYLVIRWLMHFLIHKRLSYFAYYCLGLGLLGLWYWR